MRKIVFVTAAILINHDHQILLTQRPAGKSLAGLWEFPGGKLESGEKPAECLCRELKEEIHIDVDPENCKPLTFVEYDYPDFTLFMPLYAIKKWRGEIAPQEDQDYAWVSLDDLTKYPVPPADEAVIRDLPAILRQLL